MYETRDSPYQRSVGERQRRSALADGEGVGSSRGDA